MLAAATPMRAPTSAGVTPNALVATVPRSALPAAGSASHDVPTTWVEKSTRLDSLPLPPSKQALLAQADFFTVGDLDGLSADEFADELGQGTTPAAAAQLLLQARTGGLGKEQWYSGPAAPRTKALSLLEEDRADHRLVTFSRELDALLDGGVPLRQLTEFAGAPGAGKTQLGMQLALNAQLPDAFGGLAGRAV